MEAAEALELMAGEMTQIDTAFQFWMGATFAVIVAVHTIRNSLDIRLRVTISMLYVFLALFSVLKTVGDFEQVSYFAGIAANAGHDISNSYLLAAGIFRYVIYGVGTIGAIIFVWMAGKESADGH